MAAINKQCNLHLCKSLPENEPVYTLTAKRYDTFIEYTRRWSTLCKYPEKTVALANSRYLELTFEQAGELYFHESCYKRYTDDLKLKRAKSAMESTHEDHGFKRLRSSTNDLAPSEKKRSNVLPLTCIICQKQLKWVTVGGKRVRDKFSQAETETAGQ